MTSTDAHLDERIRRDALARLAKRPMSRTRLSAGLVKRWSDSGAVESVVAGLTRAGLLDDRAFADEAIRQALAKEPAAEAMLVHRLLALGVDESLARDRAAAALAGRDPLADARDLARATYASYPASTPHTTRLRRTAGLLARRGFDEDAIESALAKLLGE